MTKNQLQNSFEELYGTGSGEIRVFFAPGGVNLIGEHIDYSGGHVLPFAITEGCCAAVRVRPDQEIHASSLTQDTGRVFRIDPAATGNSREVPDPGKEQPGSWTGRLEGVMRAFADRDMKLTAGFDILYEDNLPGGQEAFSYAPLEMVTAYMLRAVFGFDLLDDKELVEICRQAESYNTGHDSSMLGPLISIEGKADCGVFLVVGRMRFEYIPLHFDNLAVVLTDSCVRNPEAAAIVERRRTECAKALKKLQVVTNIRQLGDLSIDTFNSCKDVIMDDTYTKRARHAVTENARAIRAASAMRVGNIGRFGEIMKQSHISLRDDYEISCPELDFLAELAWDTPGVVGSRLTGGGLGGFTVSLVESGAVDSFMEKTGPAYRERFGIDPAFYTVHSGGGACEW